MGGRESSRRLLALTVFAVCLVGAGNARALTDEEIFRDFGVHFLEHGARARGMGGAFVAVADDATAVDSNPAGLNFFETPHFHAEFQGFDPDARTFRSDFGSLDVDPLTGERDLPFLSLNSAPETESLSELGFFGVVWPFHVFGTRVNVAASRHVTFSQDSSLSSGSESTEARFSFDSFPNTVEDGEVRAYSVATGVSGDIDMEIVYWSLAASVEAHPDFSFGVTLSLAELDVTADTLTEVADPLELFVDPSHPRLPSQPTTDLYRTEIDDTDDDLAYSIGVHWHPDSVFASGSSPWRFGAAFHRGARMAVLETTFLNDVLDRSFDNRIVVPDRYGVGATYRHREAWLFSLEIEQVEYSDLLEGFESGVNYLTSGRVGGDAFGLDPEAEVTFDADDGTVGRFGAEYTRSLAPDRNLSVRAGYFRSADSRVHMTGFNSDDPDVNEVYLAAFGEGEDEDHVTVGVGFSFGRSAFHAAGDFSDLGSRVLAGFAFTMGSR